MPLLGNAEKAEMGALILACLVEHFERQGASALLEPGLRIVVHSDGIRLDHGEARDPLAAVEVRTLFTALCYVTGGTLALPRDALATLATEATSATAAQINRIAQAR